MSRGWLLAALPGALAIFAGFFLVLFFIVLFFVKILWAWTIPDLFPGAVEQGLIAGTISWLTAFKIALFVTLLASLAGVRGRKS